MPRVLRRRALSLEVPESGGGEFLREVCPGCPTRRSPKQGQADRSWRHHFHPKGVERHGELSAVRGTLSVGAPRGRSFPRRVEPTRLL